MNLVTGAVGSLLPKLLKLLGNEYNLQRGLKKKVKYLELELRSIDALLKKVSHVPSDELDEQIMVWARDIREASYDMEDILDTFLVHIEGPKPNDLSRLQRAVIKIKNLFCKIKVRHDIGSAIQDIMKHLQEVADRRARYKIDDLVVNSTAINTSTSDPRLKAMYKEVTSFVGIDEPCKDLLFKLSKGQGGYMSRQKKIVSIFGTGGIGKTTIAKVVYDMLIEDFECQAFVPVGQNPNLVKLLMDILYELDKSKYADIHTKKIDKRQLIDSLREFLQNKRYIIVIDDIWETKPWTEAMDQALLENNFGSRIIITTRNAKVATQIGHEVYNIQPLSHGNAIKLFYARVSCDQRKRLETQLVETSDKILKKCAGVPLAIITLASLLAGKPTEVWSHVFTSIGFSDGDNEQVHNTMKILSFSYYDMPDYLRTCLLYLSIFPEDYMIDQDSLIWRWIAEGFIKGEPGMRLFECGEQYFNDLVNRSMIQAIESELDGMVRGCRVHDMVLDLIRSFSTKENFITVVDNDRGTVSPPPSKVRRLAFHGNIMEHTAPGNTLDIPQVRSFIAIRCSFGNQVVPLSSFKLLRVLDMEACKNVSRSHLIHLEKLLHLRYLGLERALIDDLPTEIGALKLLQILNLDRTRIRQLTESISQLTQLVCLKGDRMKTLAPNWIGELTSLEELQVALDFSNDGEEDDTRRFLKALGTLGELSVFRSRVCKMDDNMQRDLVQSLRNLEKLQQLDFWCEYRIDADASIWGEEGFVLPQKFRILHLRGFKFCRLPSCISAARLPYLAHLSLLVDSLTEKDLEFLGSLPELRYLFLFTKSTVTISNISASDTYFKKLRFCLMPHSSVSIQCQCKEEDNSSVSFHIWNGTDAMPFGTCIDDCSIRKCRRILYPYAVMPNLEVLHTRVYVRALKDGKFNCANMGLQYLNSLQKVEVRIRCEGASATEVGEVEAELRKATKGHPNRPMLEVYRWNEDKIIPTVQDQKKDKVSVEEEGQNQLEGNPMPDEGNKLKHG